MSPSCSKTCSGYPLHSECQSPCNGYKFLSVSLLLFWLFLQLSPLITHVSHTDLLAVTFRNAPKGFAFTSPFIWNALPQMFTLLTLSPPLNLCSNATISLRLGPTSLLKSIIHYPACLISSHFPIASIPF